MPGSIEREDGHDKILNTYICFVFLTDKDLQTVYCIVYSTLERGLYLLSFGQKN